MAAGAAPGLELCPHCRRPFKRLRAHLPHCKAAPPAPGSDPRPAPAGATPPAPSPASGARPTPAGAPGSALGTSPQPGTGSATGTTAGPSAAPGPGPGGGAGPGAGRGAGPGPGPGAGPGRGAGPGSRSRAVRDVARSLDLHPEEVEDVPKMLQKGVKVVIEKNRARVVREKEPRSRAGSRGEGTEPGPDPHPQRRKTAQKSKSKETRSQGAVGNGTSGSKGEKSSLKATKALQEPPESRNSPGDLVQQQGRDKFTAGEEQEHEEFRGGSKPPGSALHPEKLHLSLAEALRGQGPSRNEPGRLQSPRGGGEGAPGPAPSLALLHTPRIQPRIQPPCPARAAGRSPAGLEWFPELYPDYEGLRIFPGKRFREDVRIPEGVRIPEDVRIGIAAGTPGGAAAAQGQQGPLSERPLLEVRLGELHTWISTCSFSAQGLLGAVQRAWSSYCARYIHVKQGGPAGISMLLAGYCLLSYGWNYQHFKQHRWRKYH